MAPIRNARVLFAAIPNNFPEPGEATVYDTSQMIDLADVSLNGGFLLRTLVLSIDPYIRGRMRSPDKKAYNKAFIVGEPLDGYGIGRVVRSENRDVQVGKYVYGSALPHQEYSILPNMRGLTFLKKDPRLPWAVYLGAAGMPGKTAYMGWKEFSRAKRGEVAFITTGAGPVGSMVIQLAKRDGLKVIASAGSAEKVEFMRELGADVAFNYKTTDTREVLSREGPIDIYWDNVGGDVLDAALEHSNIGGRFLECGMISGYNTGGQSIKNLEQLIPKAISMNGIFVLLLQYKWDKQFYDTIIPALASGEYIYKNEVATGLEAVETAIVRVQKGLNNGKSLVVLADD
ncbi:alcohol dehydrogenase [Mycena crocata]|nr:alcohol dehydrogenase [Mycena crocata]